MNQSNESETIESELFTWKGWDEMDTSCQYFYDCELIKNIADIPAGTKIKGIHCDHQRSFMQLDFDEEGEDYRVFKISYCIGEEITEECRAKAGLADLKRKAERAEIAAQRAQSEFEHEQKKLQEKGIL